MSQWRPQWRPRWFAIQSELIVWLIVWSLFGFGKVWWASMNSAWSIDSLHWLVHCVIDWFVALVDWLIQLVIETGALNSIHSFIDSRWLIQLIQLVSVVLFVEPVIDRSTTCCFASCRVSITPTTSVAAAWRFSSRLKHRTMMSSNHQLMRMSIRWLDCLPFWCHMIRKQYSINTSRAVLSRYNSPTSRSSQCLTALIILSIDHLCITLIFVNG